MGLVTEFFPTRSSVLSISVSSPSRSKTEYVLVRRETSPNRNPSFFFPGLLLPPDFGVTHPSVSSTIFSTATALFFFSSVAQSIIVVTVSVSGIIGLALVSFFFFFDRSPLFSSSASISFLLLFLLFELLSLSWCKASPTTARGHNSHRSPVTVTMKVSAAVFNHHFGLIKNSISTYLLFDNA
ncbi:uncharacterized protein LOC110224594 isoform X2 [Arabidopsis lyrata subsp. lyrata]|uniref:uncharacterized protein LOC110224594 isoform X2 n=1 Tax=Arabidopsis lyrata subsp. lyrata TaxID=81972 RepID=UPI000A29E9E7|nr:uncharacterized protein LOC110224594 isoform X2 [Arabidopsis lyrata subsp. lyrata]|eukprot:XP_020866547.1 uncharacterized protein LOC110224594 isoform X2 [Arabidopsis lyrata subsp. lyrata]